jgi:hypothetical protein
VVEFESDASRMVMGFMTERDVTQAKPGWAILILDICAAVDAILSYLQHLRNPKREAQGVIMSSFTNSVAHSTHPTPPSSILVLGPPETPFSPSTPVIFSFLNLRFIQRHPLPHRTRSTRTHAPISRQPWKGFSTDEWRCIRLENANHIWSRTRRQNFLVCLETNSSSWRRKTIRYGHGRKDEFEHVICKLQPGFLVRSTFPRHRHR